MKVGDTTYTSDPDSNIMIGNISYKAWTGNGQKLYTTASSPVVNTQMYNLEMNSSTDKISSLETYLIYNGMDFYRNPSKDNNLPNGKYAWTNEAGDITILTVNENIAQGNSCYEDGTYLNWLGDTSVGKRIILDGRYFTKSVEMVVFS
mgnify:CR=1 FL=1